MTSRALLLLAALVASAAFRVSQAQDAPPPSPLKRPQRPVPALLPPEIPVSHDIGIGLQVLFEGTHAASLDNTRQREVLRQSCRARGLQYVNEAPLGSHGRFREWRVQLGSRSYSWYEGQAVTARADNPCHWYLRQVRKLTVATFDGTRTTLNEYDYNDRTLQVHVRQGDVTALGAQTPVVQRSGRAADWPVVARRVIATVPCNEQFLAAPGTRDGTGMRRCLTDEDPVDGRRAPLVLAQHVGEGRAPMVSSHAVEILPRVEVNLLVFRGPPFFRLLPSPQTRRGHERDEGSGR